MPIRINSFNPKVKTTNDENNNEQYWFSIYNNDTGQTSKSKNGIKLLDYGDPRGFYESMYSNSVGIRGYVPLWDEGWKFSNICAGFGRMLWPSWNYHEFDRTITNDLRGRMKYVYASNQVGSNKNGSMRYLPDKIDPKVLDLYPHKLKEIALNARIYGGANLAFKKHIIDTSANNIATYLGKNENVYMDRNGVLRSMSDGSQVTPPELEDAYAWGLLDFTDDFRRRAANFRYYGVNQQRIIYEEDKNAASAYLNLYRKNKGTQDKNTTINYTNITIEEDVYQSEMIYKELIEYVFGNFNEETFTWEYNGETYRIDSETNTIYDSNDEEVLYILVNDTYFSFNYQKAIAYIIKDLVKDSTTEWSTYIKNFINQVKNKGTIYNYNYECNKHGYTITENKDEYGNYSYTYTLKNQGVTEKILGTYSYWQNPRFKRDEAAYAKYTTLSKQYNGFYNSCNRLPLSKLIELNTDYTGLYNETISQTRESGSNNASYTNSFITPIMSLCYTDWSCYSYEEKNNYGIGQGKYHYGIWGDSPLLTPSNFQSNSYHPYIQQLGSFNGGNFIGYEHSNLSEDYMYIPNTDKLGSVLDNYLGYTPNVVNVVYKTDADGNTIYDDEGYPIIDDEKSSMTEVEHDVDSDSRITKRVYKSLKKYPYLIDIQNMSVEDTDAFTYTFTYNEKARNEILDSDGNVDEVEIEVEPMFQVKELKYTIDPLPYLYLNQDSSNYNQTIIYNNNYKFSPLFYFYDTTNLNMLEWTDIPATKTFSMKFFQKVLEQVDKIGKRYVKVTAEYELDGVTYKIEEHIDGDVDAIQLAMSGNKSRQTFIKSCPQVFYAMGRGHLVTYMTSAKIYYGLDVFSIAVIVTLTMWYIGDALSTNPYTVAAGIGMKSAALAIFAAAYMTALLSYRDADAQTLAYRPIRSGDFFYNIGNRWEWIYNKNKANRSDIFDTFENPSYSMDVIDNKVERKIRLNRPASRLFTDRDFKAKKTKYDKYVNNEIPSGPEYIERPFPMTALTEDELKAGTSGRRYRGGLSSKESSRKEIMDLVTDNYKLYLDKYNGEITHVYHGQKFSFTWLLNGNMRKVQILLQAGYQYLDYLSTINNLTIGSKMITTLISHRLPIYCYQKTFKIYRQLMSQTEIDTMTNNYRCYALGDVFWIFNKRKKIKVGLDFKTYIPDYKDHYGLTSNTTTNTRTNVLPYVKQMYNGENLSSHKQYASWTDWFNKNKDNIYLSSSWNISQKLDDNSMPGHMESFIETYLNGLDDKTLLDMYNADNNTNYTRIINSNYTEDNTLDGSGELTQFIAGYTEKKVDENKTQMVSNNSFILSKINHSLVSANVNIENHRFEIGEDWYDYQNVPIFRTSLSSNQTTYSIATLALAYQLELEYMIRGQSINMEEDEVTKIQQSFVTFMDKKDTDISRRVIVDYFKEQLSSIIPKRDYFITMGEFSSMLNSTNKYIDLFDSDINSANSIAYNLWIGYYVVPDNALKIVQELADEIVSWKTLQEKDGQITRGVNKNPCYVSPYLPMYLDIWKKMPYMAKEFFNQFSYTYDILYESLLITKRSDYEARLVRAFQTWTGLFLTFIAVIIAIIIAILAIIAAPFSGGSSTVFGSAAIANIFAVCGAVSAAALSIGFVCQVIGAYSSNPSTQKRFTNLAKSFYTASQIIGMATSAINVGAGLANIAQMTLSQAVTTVISTVALVTMIASSIVVASTDNESVQNTWRLVSAGAALTMTVSNFTGAAMNGGIDSSTLYDTIPVLLTQITQITNYIITLVQQNRLNELQSELDKLKSKKDELEEAYEKESEELLSMTVDQVIVAKRPVLLSQWEDQPNLLLEDKSSIDEALSEIEVDNIIEGTFSVVES